MSVLTVVVMTYNHEKYIEMAIESILSQNFSYDYNILIHDDCSSDNTYNILLNYKRKYSERITIIREDTRRFPEEGFNMMLCNYVLPFINSKYVAYCDGDDYWCDNNKLQIQYDFLEKNSNYSMCFHSAYQLRPNGDMSSKWFIKKESDIDMGDIISDRPGIDIATSSIFLRKTSFVDFSIWRKAFPVEDVPMYITAALHGKIHRLKKPMCVYRQFSIGSWSSQNRDDKNRIINHLYEMQKAYWLFDKETEYRYHNLVIKQKEGSDFRIALLNNDYKEIFSKKNKVYFRRLSFKNRIALTFKYKYPYIYDRLFKKEG